MGVFSRTCSFGSFAFRRWRGATASVVQRPPALCAVSMVVASWLAVRDISCENTPRKRSFFGALNSYERNETERGFAKTGSGQTHANIQFGRKKRHLTSAAVIGWPLKSSLSETMTGWEGGGRGRKQMPMRFGG
jgi:hypothetical protein